MQVAGGQVVIQGRESKFDKGETNQENYKQVELFTKTLMQ
jgi:hypothetical protein